MNSIHEGIIARGKHLADLYNYRRLVAAEFEKGTITESTMAELIKMNNDKIEALLDYNEAIGRALARYEAGCSFDNNNTSTH